MRSLIPLLLLAACSGSPSDKGGQGDDTGATDGGSGDGGSGDGGSGDGGSGDGGSGDGGATLDGDAWNGVYGGAGEDFAFTAEVFAAADGGAGVIVGGSTTTGTDDGYADLMLLRLDADGGEVWRRNYGEAWSQYGTAACAVPGGGFAVVGSGYAEATDSEDIFLVRTDADGEELWRAVLGDASEDESQGLLCLDDGFLVVGQSMDEAATDYDALAIRLDADGNTVWQRSFGGADQDWFRAAEATDDGGFAIVGYTASSGAGENDAWLVRVDADGTALWERTYGGVNYDYAYDLAPTEDGGWILAGATYSLKLSLYCYAWVVRTDADGAQTDELAFGDADTNDYFFGVLPDGAGGAWFTSTIASQDGGTVDAALVHVDADGQLADRLDYGGARFDALYGIAPAGDGGLVLAGATESWGAGAEDAWVTRTDADGVAPAEPAR